MFTVSCSHLLAAIEQVLPDRSAQNELRYAVYTAMDALRGILVAGFVDGDGDRLRKRWDRASVHAFEGTYGDYLLGKVGKVFPELRGAVL